ncbi:unnamed protein product [Colletotrichum noveboracense]|uniref:Uncharacterized protein n=1 Tax=Colletotrichum noveboracense TaxID=2664923 RepID=A0A9W4S1K8_9PEZI|nr:unnamed protein product [Colletotrichum noveboracense]
MKAMRLVFSSRRDLKPIELQHALSKSFMKPSEEHRPDINDILLACAGLLEVDDWIDIIYLSHYITREFLQENLDDDLAALCIDCVSSEAFDAGPCSTEDEFHERLRSYPFYYYAASNWGCHARQSLGVSSSVANFLTAESAAQAAGQALMMSNFPSQQSSSFQTIPNRISGLHLAAYFGLDEAARLLQNSIPDPRDSYLRTPLMYAVLQDHVSVSELLIHRWADVSARDSQRRAPLHLAAMLSRPDMVNLLLESGADVDAIDNFPAGEKDSSITTKLLTWGASVDERDYMGWTPLLRATLSGREIAVGDLLLGGAPVNDADENYGYISVLSIAAMMGYHSIVVTLLDNYAYIDIRDKPGCTPLLYAVANENPRIVEILCKQGADIQAKGEDGRDPLFIALSMGHELIARQLLFYGADVTSTMEGGYTPLLIAAYREYDDLAEPICRFSTPEDREAKEHFGQTPLLVATRHGHVAVARVLLNYKVDIEAKEDKFGQTSLLLAVRLGHTGIVRLLLMQGANPEAIRFDGKNAIQIASVPGREDIHDILTKWTS